MGKRDRFEYTAKDDKGKVVFKGKVADMADYFYVVQNVIYMAWKNKSKFLGEYTLERKEVNPYIPNNRYEKALNKACYYLEYFCETEVDKEKHEIIASKEEWKKWCLKDDES